MASQRTRKVEVLRVASRFIAILALIALLTVGVSPEALAQVPQGSQRHGAISKRRNAALSFSNPPVFLPTVTYSSGGYGAVSVAIADLNGDGKPDSVVVNENSNSVGVLLGKGDGTFFPVVTYDSGGVNPWSVAIADVNGDGTPDLVVANCTNAGQICGVNNPLSGGNGLVALLLGKGDGTFRPATTYKSGGWEPMSLAVADVNGDGKLDIVVGNLCISAGCENEDGTVVAGVLLGNGDGTFQDVITHRFVGTDGQAVAVANLNLDGKPDLVMTFCTSDTNCPGVIGVSLGNGDGTFQSPVIYSSGGQSPGHIAVADVNGDGYPDLIVSNVSGMLGILLGNGDGSFQNVVAYDAGGLSQGVAIGDINADGKPDVLVATWYPNTAGVLLGNGDGTFQSLLAYDPGGSIPTSIAVADINGDGRPDLVVANHYQSGLSGPGTVGVLLNNSGPQNPTTTTVGSSLNPSVYGKVVTFMAKVKSTSGTPAGSVQILNSSAVVGSGTLVNGSASIQVSTLPAGSDSITAVYLGGAGYAASKSAPLTQTVTVATTTTSLVSSINPGATNQSITFTATVASQYGGGATRSVVFNSGSQVLGTVSLSGNVASLTSAFSVAGTYVISATYSSDANNTGSTSAGLNEKILAAATTTLTSSLNPAFIGQAVTFTATITSTAGSPPNGETITFYMGSAVLGTAALSGGTASLTTSSLSAGTFTITASYPGDSTFAASTSPGLKQVVNPTSKSVTSTTLASSLNPSTYGQKVTWTATVTSSGSIKPTGTVKLTWSIYTIGWATLNSSGVATFTRSNLNADPYPLVAVYVGDAANLGSSSPILNQVVLENTSSATLTSSPNPSALGQAVTFTAKISSPTVTPTGPVTFTAGKTVLGTVQVSNGKATLTISTLAAGSTTVTVTYNGDSNIGKSTASVTQTVQ